MMAKMMAKMKLKTLHGRKKTVRSRHKGGDMRPGGQIPAFFGHRSKASLSHRPRA